MSTIRHIFLGVKSMANSLGQEPVQVPHWMQACILWATVASISAASFFVFVPERSSAERFIHQIPFLERLNPNVESRCSLPLQAACHPGEAGEGRRSCKHRLDGAVQLFPAVSLHNCRTVGAGCGTGTAALAHGRIDQHLFLISIKRACPERTVVNALFTQ